MTNIIHSLLSCVCITIPEHIFMVVITLRLMGRKDMLDFYNIKENLKSILKIVIPPAIITNILNYIIKTPTSINTLISLTILYLLLIYILKKRSIINYPKLYKKTFAYFALSVLISIIIETIAYPIILRLVGKTYDEIKLNFYLILICSLSSRIIDIMILTYIFVNKNNKFQINISDHIFNNKFFIRLFTSLIIGLVIFEIYFIKLLIHNNLLKIVETIYEQFFIVVGCAFIIPGSIIAIVYSCINYCIIIKSEKQTYHY
jgi:hypothetical protein